MSQDPFNFNFPFVNMMPEDMGDSNLMLNSMKMMGQAWQNFTSAAPQASAMAMDPNELDKRIEELKSVESWLKLNLSMLSNSIHSLEIQKANLEHFNSMMEIMSEPMKAAQSSSMFTAAQPQPDDKAKPAAEPATTEEPSEATGETTESASDEQTSFAETSGLVQDQALNWFSLLGDQFKNIVASVAANTPTETTEEKTDEQPVEKPQEPTAKKTTTRAAKKASTTKKTTAKKATAKKSSSSIAKKTVATKKADDQ